MSKALQDKIFSFLGNAGVRNSGTVQALIQRSERAPTTLNSDQTFVASSLLQCNIAICYCNAALLNYLPDVLRKHKHKQNPVILATSN